MSSDRRSFVNALVSGAAGIMIVGCSRSAANQSGTTPAAKPEHGERGESNEAKNGGGEEEITPVEDLMREHGVLRRVMYLYDDAIQRLVARRDVPLDALVGCAGVVRRVIEDYHEKLEEEFLFPRYEKAGKLADLTAILRRQHQTGRGLTDQIVALGKAPLADPDRDKLAAALRSFNHMYRPHAAREDTVLFPELRGLVGKHEYAELGEQFEDKEKQMLGDKGFERAVGDVARLEQAFGLDDLARL